MRRYHKMEELAIKIINVLYPKLRDFIGVHQSKKAMVVTLLKLEDEELIKLYDAVVHNHKEG